MLEIQGDQHWRSQIQGNTIVYPSTVLLDLSSVFEAAQAYVMLSRVQCIEQVFIYKKLPEEKIRTYLGPFEIYSWLSFRWYPDQIG